MMSEPNLDIDDGDQNHSVNLSQNNHLTAQKQRISSNYYEYQEYKDEGNLLTPNTNQIVKTEGQFSDATSQMTVQKKQTPIITAG